MPESVSTDLRRSFHNVHYLNHNARRLEHLASLQLPIRGKTVLEVGAGIGDLSSYFLDRDCRLTITEPREDSLDFLRERYPAEEIQPLDLDLTAPGTVAQHEVVFCYGVLYHLAHPANALAVLSHATTQLLLLETCVSPQADDRCVPIEEDAGNPTESTSGRGTQPTRSWIFQRLKAQFEHVYQPLTQPAHPEFPLDWSQVEESAQLTRSIFVASRTELSSPLLAESLVEKHQAMT